MFCLFLSKLLFWCEVVDQISLIADSWYWSWTCKLFHCDFLWLPVSVKLNPQAQLPVLCGRKDMYPRLPDSPQCPFWCLWVSLALLTMLHRWEKRQNSLLIQLLRSSWEERAVGKWGLWHFGDEVLQPWHRVALMRGMSCSGEGSCGWEPRKLGEGEQPGWIKKKQTQNAEFEEVREIQFPLPLCIIGRLCLEKLFFPASYTPSGTPSASVSLFQSKEYQRRLELFFFPDFRWEISRDMSTQPSSQASLLSSLFFLF